eukprot:gnl/MRDRNA2_/MRDRNA2_90598_c0_seq1.p1 gnl/MRDRNA2_/MRDRNA2_90598_c0~~gnl/MRDRNA2_/MRDRNA2_90598_c0_seq1.p1  ORF type:complete len:659 (-),score=91.49 gnl/MRDRNA2_/MRDRNA2_90598_c0_seq1:449-2425(-)
MAASPVVLPPADGKSRVSSSLACRRELQGLSVRTRNSAQRQCQANAPVDGRGTPVVANRRVRRRIKKLDDKEKIFDYFYWKDVIQEDGDGGKVVICRKKSEESSDFKYVLKIRSKASIGLGKDQEEFRRMLVKMLNIPQHNGVMPFMEVLEDKTHYYSVMEKASGGSLLSFLVSKHADGCVPELEVKQLMQEILQAVGHVHEQGVIHRDIKPSNIVVRQVTDPNNPNNGKVDRATLIDFDHADTNYTPFTPVIWSEKIWGTTGFNAPETYLGNFSPASDLFSIGVTLYLLMTGKMPYDIPALEKEIEQEACGRSKSRGSVSENLCHKVYNKMLVAEVDWTCDPWPQNTKCRNFCQSLLASGTQDRTASVAEALQHDWLANIPDPSLSPSPEPMSSPRTPMLGLKSANVPVEFAPVEQTLSKERLLTPSPRSKAQNLIDAINATARPLRNREQSEQLPQPVNNTKPPVQNLIDAMRSLTLNPDLIEPQLVLPVLSLKTQSEEEASTSMVTHLEEVETEPDTSLLEENAAEADHCPDEDQYFAHRMPLAMLTGNHFFPNRDAAFKFLSNRKTHQQQQRPKSCEQSMFPCAIRGRRDLFGLEGLSSQLSPLTPQAPQPFRSPLRPKDERRCPRSRPGRTLRGVKSNTTRICSAYLRSNSTR